ncbi:MAG: orotate phosphoribosyltransferase [Spirochaetes bacterium]|nr:orotate phosphoribosyltransferase [Spirochaetota bacterium]
MDYHKGFTEDFILDMFSKTKALLNGHFKLSSGFHSNVYLQCAKVLQFPLLNSLLSTILADRFKDKKIDVVIGPALGGVTLAYEVAKKLNCRGIFAERVTTEEDQKVMTLRRGFEIQPKENVLVVEDVITTGSSVNEIIELVKSNKGKVIGLGGIVDRSGGSIALHSDQHFLLKVNAQKYTPETCPLCKEKMPLISPGSKHV